MYVTSLRIDNLRCFARTELKLQFPGRPQESALAFPNINLLLGNNGAGKTTVLKAFALASLSPVISRSSFVPSHEIRTGRDTASVIAHVVLHEQDLTSGKEDQPAELGISLRREGDTELVEPPAGDDPRWKPMFLDKSPAFLVVGYGATRRVETSPNSIRRSSSNAGCCATSVWPACSNRPSR